MRVRRDDKVRPLGHAVDGFVLHEAPNTNAPVLREEQQRVRRRDGRKRQNRGKVRQPSRWKRRRYFILHLFIHLGPSVVLARFRLPRVPRPARVVPAVPARPLVSHSPFANPRLLHPDRIEHRGIVSSVDVMRQRRPVRVSRRFVALFQRDRVEHEERQMNQSDRVRDAVPPRSRSRVAHVRGHAHAQVSIARCHAFARERRVGVTTAAHRDLSSERDGGARETTRDGVSSRDSRRRARARRSRATRARARAPARGRDDDGRARCDDDDDDDGDGEGDGDARRARWRGRAAVPRDERRGEGGVGFVGARARERERGAGGVLVRPGQAVRE